MKTVTIDLTLADTQVLRRLITEEAKRLDHDKYQRVSDMPAKLKRLRRVAEKIWVARQEFDEPMLKAPHGTR